MATAICKLMYNITIHMTGYGVRILLTTSSVTLACFLRFPFKGHFWDTDTTVAIAIHFLLFIWTGSDSLVTSLIRRQQFSTLCT